MKTHVLYNEFHLGDCLIALHLLRALAKQAPDDQFVFFTHECNLGQLAEVASDISNLMLFSFENPMWGQERRRAINCWKNAEGAWESSPYRWDWSAYTLWHHAAIARRMGFESPLTRREHLLFDYPALEVGPTGLKFDFLVVNSEPNSGQFKPMAQHDSGYLDGFVRSLVSAGKKVLLSKPLDPPWFSTPQEANRCLQPDPDRRDPSITKYGYLSTLCRHHIMIATGPMWPTLNTNNHHYHEGRRRIVLLDNGERLNMPHIQQCASVDEVTEIAREEGWI